MLTTIEKSKKVETEERPPGLEELEIKLSCQGIVTVVGMGID